MAKIKMNFKDVETFSKLSEGIHEVEIMNIKAGKSSKETPKLEISMKSTDGGTITHNLYMTEKTKWKVKEFLEAVGEDVPDGTLTFDTDELVGRLCRIEVYHEEYDGKTYAKVDTFMSPSVKGAPADEIFEGVEPDEEEEEDILDLL